ncbi:MAG: FGGY-family carbohydrate kinase [Christensenellaceae bacterium]
MTFIIDKQSIVPDLRKYNFSIVPFMEDGLYAVYAFNMSGGCIVKWFLKTLGREANYEQLNQEMPVTPTNLTVIPYFAGSGTPYMDSKTPAAIIGMRLKTTRGELFRAFLEGESYEMNVNIQSMYDAGIYPKKIIAVGGGTKSVKWMQIRADVFGRKIYITNIGEAGTLASAILCFVKLGVYSSVQEAQKKYINIAQEYQPISENVIQYKRSYQKYAKLYKLLKNSDISKE